jgi:hypothetical protein
VGEVKENLKLQNAGTLKLTDIGRKISHLSFTHWALYAYKLSLKFKVVMSTAALILIE